MNLDLEGRRKIRAAKHRIAETLDAKGVLKGLSEAQRTKLVDHVFFVDHHHSFRAQLGPYEQRVDRLFKRGPGQLRKLSSQIDKLRAAAKKVSEQVASIEDDTTPSGNFYLADALHQVELFEPLEVVVTALQRLQLPPPAIFDKIPGHRTSADDPTVWATQRLHEFFTTECGLTRNESSQRIAKIENALWRGNLQENDPGSYTRNRSSAIRKRLLRNRPSNNR